MDTDKPTRPEPGPGRTRKRTAQQVIERYQQLETVCEAKGWRLSVALENITCSIEEIASCPDDSYVLIMAGPSESAIAVTERYQVFQPKTEEGKADAGGVIRETGRLIALHYTMAERAATLAERSLAGFETLVKTANKLGQLTTRSLRKQIKERRKRLSAEEEADGGIGSIIKEVTGILGPEKTERLITSFLKKEEPQKKKARRKRAHRKT